MQLTQSILIDSYRFFADILAENKYVVEKKSEDYAKTFLTLLGKHYHSTTLRSDFLWLYLVFQFNYWQGVELRSFDRRMKFSFIFGRKAFKRYLERDQEFDWVLQGCEVSRAVSRVKFNKKFSVIEKRDTPNVESIHRSRFLNKEAGLGNCLALTTLYDPEDNNCKQCNFKGECKELLRMNYPKFYRKRIELKKIENRGK